MSKIEIRCTLQKITNLILEFGIEELSAECYLMCSEFSLIHDWVPNDVIHITVERLRNE